MTRMTNLLRRASYQLVGTLDSCVCRIECCGVSLPRISSDEPTRWTGACRFASTGNDVLQEHVRYGDLRLNERLKMLPLLRQVRECGGEARLKLRYGFSVITPANLAFASGEDKCLFGSEAPVLRRFPHSLSEFLVLKQQTQ